MNYEEVEDKVKDGDRNHKISFILLFFQQKYIKQLLYYVPGVQKSVS